MKPTWIVRALLAYSAAVPMLCAGIAYAADPATIAEVGARTPVVALVILFSSSTLAGASALFWKIYKAQADNVKELGGALREQAAATRDLQAVLDARLPPRI